MVSVAYNSAAAAQPDDNILSLAEQVGLWLVSNANYDDETDAVTWLDDVLNPETVGYDLAAGVSGKVLFFVALYRATDNEEYLQYAKGGADYLVSLLQDPASFEGNKRRASLYSGVGGIGVALLNVHSVVADPQYLQAVNRIVELLDQWSITGATGLHWSDEFNDLLYGEVGMVLFLSFVADQTGNERAADMARDGATYLLGEEQSADTGSFWYFRRGKPLNLPNFSHGTAGMGYLFATLASQTGDERYEVAATSAVAYLDSIAEEQNALWAIPYGWGMDSWDGLYEFGWAHGIAGTALFLERMIQADIASEQADALSKQLKQSLLNMNLPGAPLEPFGEPATPLDMRFGRAGVLTLLSEWSRSDRDTVATRDAIWRDLSDAAIKSQPGAYWEVDAPAFMGGGRAAYTGYFHGAAGIGLSLLKMHAATTDKKPYVVLPDDPFSWMPR